MIQVREPLFQIEGGANAFQSQAKLNHRKSDLRLNTDNYGFRAAQTNHESNLSEGARGERIHDVHGGDIDDHRARTKAHDTLNEREAKMLQIGIRQRSLNGGDKKLALLKNWDFQMYLLPAGLSWLRHRHDFVSQKLFGLFNAALQIADGVHLSEIHTDSDEGLGNFRGKACDDNGRAEEA